MAFFSIYWNNIIPIDELIFSEGKVYHQPDYIYITTNMMMGTLAISFSRRKNINIHGSNHQQQQGFNQFDIWMWCNIDIWYLTINDDMLLICAMVPWKWATPQNGHDDRPHGHHSPVQWLHHPKVCTKTLVLPMHLHVEPYVYVIHFFNQYWQTPNKQAPLVPVTVYTPYDWGWLHPDCWRKYPYY